MESKKIVVEVWSDIMCPFCYIGKKNFEKALQQIPNADQFQVEWKSFQLDPEIPENTSFLGEKEYLAQRKGMQEAQVREMLQYVTEAGANAGIKMNFDRSIVANTQRAHRLLHFAKQTNQANALKERLFAAHFTDGLDVGNREVLSQLAAEVGLDSSEVNRVLNSDEFAYDVIQDIQEGANIGVRGVPFFVIDRKYAVSGAQPVEVFVETLEKAAAEN
jgi:predicted DsbA family dithiol-disulfide isomerase